MSEDCIMSVTALNTGRAGHLPAPSGLRARVLAPAPVTSAVRDSGEAGARCHNTSHGIRHKHSQYQPCGFMSDNLIVNPFNFYYFYM